MIMPTLSLALPSATPVDSYIALSITFMPLPLTLPSFSYKANLHSYLLVLSIASTNSL